ncbi:hypothetical protein BOTCAL_0039g00050 [Botryotinia calthae]|uniref:SNF2 N-terminal domain-containing protein n=1 Tax=Botryotinia calthae TaxID=38488 RepID=A0A4Y8DCI6_9HELO|nr:hypothetical protein BOTCAL_0039g00050 [Botryotinia calthae]
MDNSVHSSKNSFTPSRTQQSISTNTSTATSPTIDVTNLPAVIKWGDTESWHYIGAQHHQLRMNIHLGTKEIPQLLFWFSVTVAVTMSPGSSMSRTKLLYFVIPGSLFDWSKYDTSLLLGAPTSGYSLDTSTAIKQAGISSDCTSVFRIHFQLLDHGTVFMPSTEEHAFTPISDSVLQLLTDLRSLSQTKEFWAYLPSEGLNLANLRKRIDRLRGGTFTGDFTTQSVYKPSMVCNKWTNFNQFVKKKNPAKLNSDLLPAYNSGSQSAGIKRKGIHQNDDLDQAFIETESDEESHIEQEQERKHIKISSDIIPNHRSSKVRFIEPHSEDLSFLRKQFVEFTTWYKEKEIVANNVFLMLNLVTSQSTTFWVISINRQRILMLPLASPLPAFLSKSSRMIQATSNNASIEKDSSQSIEEAMSSYSCGFPINDEVESNTNIPVVQGIFQRSNSNMPDDVRKIPSFLHLNSTRLGHAVKCPGTAPHRMPRIYQAYGVFWMLKQRTHDVLGGLLADGSKDADLRRRHLPPSTKAMLQASGATCPSQEEWHVQCPCVSGSLSSQIFRQITNGPALIAVPPRLIPQWKQEFDAAFSYPDNKLKLFIEHHNCPSDAFTDTQSETLRSMVSSPKSKCNATQFIILTAANVNLDWKIRPLFRPLAPHYIQSYARDLSAISHPLMLSRRGGGSGRST